MSDYLEAALIGHVLRNVAYTSPTTVYLSLHTADPTDADVAGELSGDGYARQACAFDAPGATDGLTQNTAAEAFTAAGGDWGTVTHIGIYDALTGGNLLFHGEMTYAKSVDDTKTLTFDAGDLTITLA